MFWKYFHGQHSDVIKLYLLYLQSWDDLTRVVLEIVRRCADCFALGCVYIKNIYYIYSIYIHKMTLPFDMYFRFGGGFTNQSQEYYGDFLEWSTSMRTTNNHQPAGETHLARLRKRLDSWQQQIGKARRRRANQAHDDPGCRWNGKLDFGGPWS